ncbi:MAG: ThuA domain-containing protein [Beutenbergiaceae bacterium]
MRSDVLVVTGAGRYGDPWHDFPATSARLAQLLRQAGLRVAVASTDDPPTAQEARLVVVNAGGGAAALPGTADDACSRWREYVIDHALRGGPVLAVHAATNTFYDEPRWWELLGGRWLPGVSSHPPLERSMVQITEHRHPITAGWDDFEVRDERYSHLQVVSDSVLVTHTYDGDSHPIVWTNRWHRAFVVVDTLGHDVAAYGPNRRALLEREIDWLLREG